MEDEKLLLQIKTNAEIARGFDNLPVLERLQFVSDVLCERAGNFGEPHYDSTLILLVEILDRSVRVLKAVPGIQEVRLAKPDGP